MVGQHPSKLARWLATLALIVPFARTAGAEEREPRHHEPHRFGIVPVGAVLYTPESSVIFAAAALAHFRIGDLQKSRDSQALLSVAYTLEHQVVTNLRGELFLHENAIMIGYELEFSHFPSKFFGIGNDTSLDDEEPYTRRSYVASLSPLYRVWRALYAGPAARFKYYDIRETEPGGRLEANGVTGAEGGRDVALGATVIWDTRDVTLNPAYGLFAELDLLRSASYTGSEFQHTTYALDVRGYIPTFSRQVLALQANLELHDGEPPFFLLSRFGGSSLMRGHYQGRYRDRQMAAAQAEYRVPVWWRFGVVGFGGLGQVARDVDDLRLDELHASAGGGLRFLVSRSSRVNARADFAWGEDDFGVYVALGEAF